MYNWGLGEMKKQIVISYRTYDGYVKYIERKNECFRYNERERIRIIGIIRIWI